MALLLLNINRRQLGSYDDQKARGPHGHASGGGSWRAQSREGAKTGFGNGKIRETVLLLIFILLLILFLILIFILILISF